MIRHQADDPVGPPTEYADAHLSLATTEAELLPLQCLAAYFTPDRLECGDDSELPQHYIRSPYVILRRTLLVASTAIAAAVSTLTITPAAASPRAAKTSRMSLRLAPPRP
ncbi:hypothetical protein [Streptomyces sp. NBC_01643]|uniref:hypothetical protein n=1 Tax=Streptomyces sp. NBC_01643 TaxID=2975906 RepID=UPI002F90BA66|nr:hypothetical protein OHB03_48590 [Streptomyces sp. NBC_01643]